MEFMEKFESRSKKKSETVYDTAFNKGYQKGCADTWGYSLKIIMVMGAVLIVYIAFSAIVTIYRIRHGL